MGSVDMASSDHQVPAEVMGPHAIVTASTGFPSQYEFIDPKELARRWCLPESWVREQVRRRSADPLPHVKFGKYTRFRWGSPELEAWAQRRIVGLHDGRMSRIAA